MSEFRRNLLKMGGGRMIEVTQRYKTVSGKAVANPVVGEVPTVASDAAYSYIQVPKEANLYADVCQWGNGTYPIHMIAYCDENDICVAVDAPVSELKTYQYNRYKLRFPAKAAYAYVTSSQNVFASSLHFPPKIFKKVFGQ